jgi:hypothetical protein
MIDGESSDVTKPEEVETHSTELRKLTFEVSFAIP